VDYPPKLKVIQQRRMNLTKVQDKPKKGLIFVISGPSGSGKTTLAQKILNKLKSRYKFAKSVSFTTRPKRKGERQGEDYLFISAEEFQKLLKAKKILEHTRYLGYDYGTPCDFFKQALRRGLNIILCLDISGALFVKKTYPHKAITIFVMPPCLNIAKKRILSRSAQTQAGEINKRIQLANKELRYATQYDYCLVNDNLNQAIKELVNIIQQVLG
jgi:guanylate kinase